MELYASLCVLSRWSSEVQDSAGKSATSDCDDGVAELFLRNSSRHIRRALSSLRENDDQFLLETAKKLGM